MNLAFSELSSPFKRGKSATPRRKAVTLHHPEHSFSTTNTPFGTIHLRTITLFFAHDTCKVRITIPLHPSRFLQLCGVRFGLKIVLSKSPGTIEHALRPYTAIPDNAIIFKLFWERRTDAINNLLEKRLASPWDTNSYGETPLMIAALAGRLDTCKFLLRNGADVEARTIVGE
ncbi:hypothetical protein OCU04_009561 [Sclerotinia nivalis]|uniref:Ankyrin n=1 Tax=Sclerotinia nivalis TaxID=352851 RepID=A0A9X0AG67_9HELO|nr:hypothetical protein OCU04_009561 [Sclerotinia nivalis]